MGFADPARAERLLLTDLGVTAAELKTDPLVTAVAAAADPDLAVAGLSRLFAAAGWPRCSASASAWLTTWPGTRRTPSSCAAPSPAPLRPNCGRACCVPSAR